MDQHQMPPLPVEFTISPRAKKALKGNWPTALLIAFGAGLMNTLFQVVYTIALNPAMETMNAQLQQGYPPEFVLQKLMEMLQASAPQIALLGLLTFMLTPVLTMGFRAYCFKLLKGEEGSFRDLFSRLNLFFKSLGQSLMISLRIMLWTLLSVAAVTAVIFGLTFAGMEMAAMMALAPMLSIAASIPAVMAVFRYMLAPFAMAEDPSMKINASIRLSAKLMKKRKLRLLGLTIGWELLNQLGSSVLQLLLGSVVGLALGMLVSLACSVVVQMITASFYLTYREVDGV